MDTHTTLGYHGEVQSTVGELETTRVEVKRIVVLVPDQGAYGTDLARRIWSLAAPCELKVLFLCVLESQAMQESALRLRLATLSALIRDEKIQVDTRIVAQQTWVEAVRRFWQPGDIVICCAEHMISTTIHGRLALSQIIEAVLDLPVYVLPGLYTAEPAPHTNPTHFLGRWLVLLLIVAGAFYIDKQVIGITIDPAHLFLFVFISLAEVGLLAAWALFN